MRWLVIDAMKAQLSEKGHAWETCQRMKRPLKHKLYVYPKSSLGKPPSREAFTKKHSYWILKQFKSNHDYNIYIVLQTTC